MSVRRTLWRLWGRFLGGSERTRDRVLDGFDGARESVRDAIVRVREGFHDAGQALLDRLSGLGGVAAIASLIVAVGVGVVLFQFAASGGSDQLPPLQPAPIVRSPVSLAPGAPVPVPSLAIEQ